MLYARRDIFTLSTTFACLLAFSYGDNNSSIWVSQDQLAGCAAKLAAEVDKTYVTLGVDSNATARKARVVDAATNFTTGCLGLSVRPTTAGVRALRIMAPKAPILGVLSRRAAEFEQARGVRVVLNPVEFFQVGAEITQELERGLNGFSDGWVIDPSVTGEVASLGGFKSMDQYIPEDPTIDWSDISRFFRVASAIYDRKVVAIPMDGDLMLMYYRRDLFERYRLSIPHTWDEFVDLALRMNGTDTNNDGVPDLYGVCFDTAPPVCKGNFLLTAMAAPYIQYQGTSQGVFYDAETMHPLADNAAMARALEHMVALFGVQPQTPSCAASNAAFRNGTCLMTINWGDEFKANALLNSTGLPGGAMSVAPLPGAAEVLDRTTGRLVPCSGPDMCPYAKLERLANGSTAYVNYAPYSAFGGWAGAISSLADPEYQLLAYQFFAFLVQPNNSWHDLLDPNTGIDPYRRSQLQSSKRWEDAGYEPNATTAYLAAVNEALESENMVLDSRLEFVGVPTRLIFEAGLQNLTWGRAANPNATVAGTLREVDRQIEAGLRATGTVLQLQRQYCKLIGCSLGWLDASVRKDRSHDGLLALAVAIPVAVTVSAAVLLLALVLWRRHSNRRHLLTGGIRAPGAGPATTLLITDIESSTTLWELLPEEVMGKAVEVHHSVIRRALAKFSGYESATEGDSFICAFHTATEAVQCAMHIQQELLTAPWPPALLACTECPAVAEVSLTPGPTHAEAVAILTPRGAGTVGTHGGGGGSDTQGRDAAGGAGKRGWLLLNDGGGGGGGGGGGPFGWLPWRRRRDQHHSTFAGAVPSPDVLALSFNHPPELSRAGYSYTTDAASTAAPISGAGFGYGQSCAAGHDDGPTSAGVAAAAAAAAALVAKGTAGGGGGAALAPHSVCSATDGMGPEGGDVASFGDMSGSVGAVAAAAGILLRFNKSAAGGGAGPASEVPARSPFHTPSAGTADGGQAEVGGGGGGAKAADAGIARTGTAGVTLTSEVAYGLPSICSVGSRPSLREDLHTSPLPPGMSAAAAAAAAAASASRDPGRAGVLTASRVLADYLASAWRVAPPDQPSVSVATEAGLANRSSDPDVPATTGATSPGFIRSSFGMLGSSGGAVGAGGGAPRRQTSRRKLRPGASRAAAVRVYRGLRVRIGMASGVPEASDVIYNAAEARYHYSGAAMRLARAVQGAAAGGMVLLSDTTFAQQRQENGGANLTLTTAAGGGGSAGNNVGATTSGGRAGGSGGADGGGGGDGAVSPGSTAGSEGSGVVFWLHMGQHDLHRDLSPQQVYQVISQQLAGRLALFPPLVVRRCLAAGVHGAPVRRAAVAFVYAVGAANLLAWDAAVARQSLALLEESFVRELAGSRDGDCGGAGRAGGYLVEATGGLLLAAFPDPGQAVACCLATVSGLLSVAWPDALLENALCEELAVARVDSAGLVTQEVLFRGLRIKAGLDYGPVHAAINGATGRLMYRGRVMNRAARIASHASTGQVLCSRDLYDAATGATITPANAAGAPSPELRPDALGFTALSMGPASLKGLPEPVELLLCRPAERPQPSRRVSGLSRAGQPLLSPAATAEPVAVDAVAAETARLVGDRDTDNDAPPASAVSPRSFRGRAELPSGVMTASATSPPLQLPPAAPSPTRQMRAPPLPAPRSASGASLLSMPAAAAALAATAPPVPLMPAAPYAPASSPQGSPRASSGPSPTMSFTRFRTNPNL